jgi:hypothetical protein
MKSVRVDPFLLTHEIAEKPLLDELRLHYLHAHKIAVRAEHDAVSRGRSQELEALQQQSDKSHHQDRP